MYIRLTERAVVEISGLNFLKPIVCRHIPHQYIKETRGKSDMVRYQTIKAQSKCNVNRLDIYLRCLHGNVKRKLEVQFGQKRHLFR